MEYRFRLQPSERALENQQNLGAAQPKDCGAPRVGAALPRAWSACRQKELPSLRIVVRPVLELPCLERGAPCRQMYYELLCNEQTYKLS